MSSDVESASNSPDVEEGISDDGIHGIHLPDASLVESCRVSESQMAQEVRLARKVPKGYCEEQTSL
jgi:hypothetical protein